VADSPSQNFDNAEGYETEQNTVREYIQQHGVAGFENDITKRVSAWRNTPLNIAVTEFTSVGKSTLINTFCRRIPADEGAAKTDTTECTHVIKCYSHPTNKNLNFFDSFQVCFSRISHCTVCIARVNMKSNNIIAN
jgi:predicted GTPase